MAKQRLVKSTTRDPHQLEARIKAIQIANDHGLWFLLFDLSQGGCNWIDVLRIIKRVAEKR